MFARIRSAPGATVLGEVLMLVVGINIALWFEGKFEDFSDAETEQQYLRGLRDDLETDLDRLEGVIEFNETKSARLSSLLPQLAGLGDAPADELLQAMFEPSSYDFFSPADFTFRSMQESGDFRLLSDEATKQGLLKLARRYRELDQIQQNFLQALDDGYIPLMMAGFDMVNARLGDPALVDNLAFRNFFAYALQDTQQRTLYMADARKQAEALLKLVASQVRE
jgi:hypothetical protein